MLLCVYKCLLETVWFFREGDLPKWPVKITHRQRVELESVKKGR